MRYLLRLWGEGFNPSDQLVNVTAQSYTTTPAMKHILKGTVVQSLEGLGIPHRTNPPPLPPIFREFLNVPIPRKGSLPFSQKWVLALLSTATGVRTPFGVTMTLNQVVKLVTDIPEVAEPVPKSTLAHPISDDILVSEERWAVATDSGYKFRAGEVLKHSREKWVAVATGPAKKKIYDILTMGWNPTPTHTVCPTWFQDHNLKDHEVLAWDNEVISLLQMGSVSQITKSHVQKYGLPQVVLPIFLVEEKDKFRPIMDARFSNVPFLPPWFSLPKIQDFLASLSKDLFWFKCDVKGGWHHIPIAQDHSNFFAFQWKGKLYQYNVCPFGDATAPYCFTYLMITLKKILKARGLRVFTLYIDDLLVPASLSFEEASLLRTQVINAQLDLNLVLGAKKCPPPSKSGEALGFWVDTHTGIVTFTQEKFGKIRDLAFTIKQTWKQGKKVHART